MESNHDVWVRKYAGQKLIEPVAVVGSPGLRSIGKLVVDDFIVQTNAQLLADLYSTHLPSVYQTTPSYAAHPSLPGMGGAVVESGNVDFPKVQFYYSFDPPLIFGRGYHANFAGQYRIAEGVVDFLSEMKVRRIIVVAGYGTKEKNVVCAATNKDGISEMKEKFDVGVGYKGPFMGFSGLVFGLAKLRGIEAVCLFSGTEPKEDDLELPDKEASDRVVEVLNRMLGIQK